MAELLTAKEILGALENIIKKAEKYICIFTFNIKIDPNYLARLRNASKRGIKITIVFGVENGENEVLTELLELPNCSVYFKEYLHAKFYYNEKELLVGSMNLSEASAKNNFELGVYFTGDRYAQVIKKVKEEAKEIVADATEWRTLQKLKTRTNVFSYTPAQYITQTNVVKEKRPQYQEMQKTCCIRCGNHIKYNPAKPFCTDCYYEWAEWENEHYLENYCHNCGGKSEVSFAKPECYDCWQINNLLIK
jgi:phosphatidylserine/phosphatidylglycerophosphate/cardiolipin synthase-like enzyme